MLVSPQAGDEPRGHPLETPRRRSSARSGEGAACGLQTGRWAPLQHVQRVQGRDAWLTAIMMKSTIARAGEAVKGRGASHSRWECKLVSNCGRQYGGSLKTENRATTVHVCWVALVMSHSLQPHGLQPARLLCPWRFSRQE